MFAGLVIIAANAGGAWSPIGDVTTTMLWLSGQISAGNIIVKTFLASFICFAVPAFVISMQMKGKLEKLTTKKQKLTSRPGERKAVFFIGIGALLFVPDF